MRIALAVEYDGTCYSGFQYQRNARSIQEELEKAIAGLTGEKVRIRGAGRTDAGVHAAGQVAAFDTASGYGPQTVLNALNHHLPADIAVKAAARAADDFDPRRHAVSRRYGYTILNSRTRSPLRRRDCHREPSPLDAGAMARAARTFVGVHDFARFAGRPDRPEASTVRRVTDVCVSRTGEIVRIEVEGNAFLPRQVRRMAGALVDVGRGALTSENIGSMLAGEETRAAARSLPARGLCLLNVKYPERIFGDGEEDGSSI